MSDKESQTGGAKDEGRKPTDEAGGTKGTVPISEKGLGNGDSPQDDKGPQFSLSQRFSVGLNVAVMVVASAALLILVNWIASKTAVYRDWSTKGRYSLSERTVKVLKSANKPIRLTVIYTSKDAKKVRDEATGAEFKPRVAELAEDIRAVGANVTVEDVTTPQQQDELVGRIEEQQKRAAASLTEKVDAFKAAQPRWSRSAQEVGQRVQEVMRKSEQMPWMLLFEQGYNAFSSKLPAVATALAKAADELNKLDARTKAGGEAGGAAIDQEGKIASDAPVAVRDLVQRNRRWAARGRQVSQGVCRREGHPHRPVQGPGCRVPQGGRGSGRGDGGDDPAGIPDQADRHDQAGNAARRRSVRRGHAG